jgi:hypothetical protein
MEDGRGGHQGSHMWCHEKPVDGGSVRQVLECRCGYQSLAEVTRQRTDPVIGKIERLPIDNRITGIGDDDEIQVETIVGAIHKVVRDICGVIPIYELISIIPPSIVAGRRFEIAEFVMDIGKDGIHVISDIGRFYFSVTVEKNGLG